MHFGRLGHDKRAERIVSTVKIQLLTATVGAAILLAGAPAFAAPTDTTGPIQINNVQAHGGASEDNDGSFNFIPASVSISFKNQSNSPATSVVFALENNGYVVGRFDDRGSFAKGTAIEHKFALNQTGANESVAVAEATFADGTVWHNPAVALEQQPVAPEGVQVAVRF
jgi:hypothetical protein